MNETEIRRRVRAAFGDSSYPPELTARVTSRLAYPLRPSAGPRLLTFVAALLAFAIVATLIFIRFQSSPRILAPVGPGPVASPAANPHKPPAADVIGVSQADLDRTQLSMVGDEVTPLKLSSTSNGRTVTLVGAYADSARTVLFFRSMPAARFIHANVYDQTGFLNAASTAGPGSIGDYYFILDMGPHAGPDGLAHLKVMADLADLPPAKLTQGGAFSFEFSLSVGANSHLGLQPPLTAVGTWQFTIEAMELTPTLIHFEAVISGAAVEDITQDTVKLTDAISGKPAEQVSEDASTTVPKSQIGSTPPRSTRVNITWQRPTVVATYNLTISGGGAVYHGVFAVPAPGNRYPKGGGPLLPTSYPPSQESLNLDGALSATISSGNPTACGAGTGPSGTIFAFATYFQVDQVWYWLNTSIDPRDRNYTGPGTYTVLGELAPLGASDIFQGPVRLTVSERGPGSFSGTMQGTLRWTGDDPSAATVNVSGSWQCVWSDQLGPG